MTHGPELVPLQAYMAAKCEVCVCDCQSKIDALQAEVERLKGDVGRIPQDIDKEGIVLIRFWREYCAEQRDRALAAEARVKELIDADAGRNALLDKAEAEVEVLRTALDRAERALAVEHGRVCGCRSMMSDPCPLSNEVDAARAALGAERADHE
jgi:multidrug resistance efflux pump